LNLSDEDRAKQALQDPEVREIMADPVMQTVLDQMSKDPTAAQE
jgi:stress-induced-phosphoprotein 1